MGERRASKLYGGCTMAELRHKRLGEAVDTTAPDGSEVRFLLRGDRAS